MRGGGSLATEAMNRAAGAGGVALLCVLDPQTAPPAKTKGAGRMCDSAAQLPQSALAPSCSSGGGGRRGRETGLRGCQGGHAVPHRRMARRRRPRSGARWPLGPPRPRCVIGRLAGDDSAPPLRSSRVALPAAHSPPPVRSGHTSEEARAEARRPPPSPRRWGPSWGRPVGSRASFA